LRAASGRDARVAIGAEGDHARREVGDTGVAESAQPLRDGVLVPRSHDVADVAGVSVLE
jgi:hypothetical protein